MYGYKYQRFIISSENSLKPGNVIFINGEWLLIQGDGVKIEKIALENGL
jgi:hypothetical protein